MFLLTGLLQAFILKEKPPEQIMNRFLTLSGATGHYGYSEYLWLSASASTSLV